MIKKWLSKCRILKAPDSAYVSVEKNLVNEYNKHRPYGAKKYFCYAPFNNIYLNTFGNPAACWQSFFYEDSYPKKSLKEIWFGENFTRLREHISHDDLTFKCSECERNLKNKNYYTVLARAYDNQYPLTKYPSVMELELDNNCNLECIMCSSNLSSNVHKKDVNAIPYSSPYDSSFVKEFEEFVPYLNEVRFNGGEPFLINIYYDLWELILKMKPGIKMVVATNGTVLNDRVKTLLAKGKFHINFSLDSLNKETYELIRKNAVYEETMDNLKFFQDYCIKNKTTLCILANPMRQNWLEMPEFVKLCNTHNLPLWYNTIIRPENCALWTLPSVELTEIFNTLSSTTFAVNPLKSQSYHNQGVYYNLVFGQIKTWLEEAIEREKRS